MPVEVEVDTEYTQIGIKSHGKGIFYKEPVTGKELGNKRVFWIEPNCFVVNIVFAWERAVARTTDKEKGYIASHRFPMYRTNDTFVDLDYITIYFVTNRGQNILQLASPGGAGRNKTLGQSEFMSSTVWLPCLKEQQKTAKFLTLLDERIAKQRELVENLKSYKRGVLSAIFSRKVRFKKTTGESYPEWQVIKLCDMFCKITVRNTNNTVTNVITNSAEYGLIPQIDYFDKEIANSENTSGYYVIQKNDFVYNPRKSNSAPYGPFNCYSHDEIGIISPLYTALRLKTKCNIEYLSWYFKSSSWYRYIYDNGSQGVRHDRVSMTDELLFGIPILLPSDEEQAKIAQYLTFLNDYACSAEQILDKMIKVKDNLVNEMFI